MRDQTVRGRGLRLLLLGLSLAIAGCGQKNTQKNIQVQQLAGYSDEERQKVTRVIVNDDTVVIQRHDGSVVTMDNVEDQDQITVEAPGPVEIYENGSVRVVNGNGQTPTTSGPASPTTTTTGVNGTAPPQVVTLPNGQTAVVAGGSQGNGGAATGPASGSVPFNGTTINVANPGSGAPGRDTTTGIQSDGSFRGTFAGGNSGSTSVSQGTPNRSNISGDGFQPVDYGADALTQEDANRALGTAQQPS